MNLCDSQNQSKLTHHLWVYFPGIGDELKRLNFAGPSPLCGHAPHKIRPQEPEPLPFASKDHYAHAEPMWTGTAPVLCLYGA